MIEEVVIEPGSSVKTYWKDVWRYRELFFILSWRDIKVRYKQTVIGAAWSIIRPVLTTIVFTIVFGRVAKIENQSLAPYALMVYGGMMPWQFFSNALSEASNSLIGNTNLISKVYFPRLIVPASSVITSFVDFAISFVILIVLLFLYNFMPPVQILLLPLFVVLAFFAAFGIGLFITALNVKYRDFRYIIPFIVQFGLYITPVGFSSGNIPDKWRMVYALNPMVGVIDGFRWCLFGDKLILSSLMISVTVIFISMWLGVWYFRKTERNFADII
jgi:lipopolysaccharide transport system permease protein